MTDLLNALLASPIGFILLLLVLPQVLMHWLKLRKLDTNTDAYVSREEHDKMSTELRREIALCRERLARLE